MKVEYCADSESIFWGGSRIFSHRENGPCMISDSGYISFVDDNCCRNRGPAFISPSGAISYKNYIDSFHRTDGPAVIHADGNKEYYVDGEPLSQLEFFLKYRVV